MSSARSLTGQRRRKADPNFAGRPEGIETATSLVRLRQDKVAAVEAEASVAQGPVRWLQQARLAYAQRQLEMAKAVAALSRNEIRAGKADRSDRREGRKEGAE